MHAILSNDLVQSINELRDLDVLLVSILPMKIMGSNKSKPRLWEAMRIQNQDIKSVSFERPICTYVLLSYIWMSQMKGDLGMYFVVPHALKMEWDGKQMNPTHGPTRVRNPSGCPCDITGNLTWYQGFHFCEVFRSCLCLLWYPSSLCFTYSWLTLLLFSMYEFLHYHEQIGVVSEGGYWLAGYMLLGLFPNNLSFWDSWLSDYSNQTVVFLKFEKIEFFG